MARRGSRSGWPEQVLVALVVALGVVVAVSPSSRRDPRQRGIPFVVRMRSRRRAGSTSTRRRSVSTHSAFRPQAGSSERHRRAFRARAHPARAGQPRRRPERGRRSGTENVAGAVGLAAAIRLGEAGRQARADAAAEAGMPSWPRCCGRVPRAALTGHPTLRLPATASFVFPGMSGESVLLELERRGIVSSSGSACAAGSDEASHVLLALGFDDEVAQTAVRFLHQGSGGRCRRPVRGGAAVAEALEAVMSMQGGGHRRAVGSATACRCSDAGYPDTVESVLEKELRFRRCHRRCTGRRTDHTARNTRGDLAGAGDVRRDPQRDDHDQRHPAADGRVRRIDAVRPVAVDRVHADDGGRSSR